MHSREPDYRGELDYHGPDRRSRDARGVEPVVLTRKHAEAIDGVNLAGHYVGDRLAVSRREARLLIAEGWAAPARPEERRRPSD